MRDYEERKTYKLPSICYKIEKRLLQIRCRIRFNVQIVQSVQIVYESAEFSAMQGDTDLLDSWDNKWSHGDGIARSIWRRPAKRLPATDMAGVEITP